MLFDLQFEIGHKAGLEVVAVIEIVAGPDAGVGYKWASLLIIGFCLNSVGNFAGKL